MSGKWGYSPTFRSHVRSADDPSGIIEHRVEVVRLVVSPTHAFEGRPSDGPAPTATTTPAEIEIRAGHGVVGDRYAGRRAHQDAAVTVASSEALDAVADELGVARWDPALTRRTIILAGFDVETLRGQDFTLDAGDGPVPLGGRRPAAPCAWMDVVLAPGAHRALRGRAGVRCAALGSGVIRLGPAVLSTAPPPDGSDAVSDGPPRAPSALPSRAGSPRTARR